MYRPKLADVGSNAGADDCGSLAVRGRYDGKGSGNVFLIDTGWRTASVLVGRLMCGFPMKRAERDGYTSSECNRQCSHTIFLSSDPPPTFILVSAVSLDNGGFGDMYCL